jgi:hypothetical protein
MQLWFLTGFSRARQKIGILSFFHPKKYSIEKHVQLVKLSTRSQTRRVKLYSIESQNQVDFCCLICFLFVTAVLEKQIQKECGLRNRALPPFVTLPPFVSDCRDPSGYLARSSIYGAQVSRWNRRILHMVIWSSQSPIAWMLRPR